MKEKKLSISQYSPKRLKDTYEAVCEEYANRLADQWEYDRDDFFWIGKDFGMLAIGDSYYISNEDVRLCVDEAVDIDTFVDWYYYHLQIGYGQELGVKEAIDINLYSWLRGYPEEQKVPKETREEWERLYWEDFKKELEEGK